MEKQDYKKYRWFFTKSGKLVYGGKSAEQNDLLMKDLKEERVIMHTHIPGSPFSVIDAPVKKVSVLDLEEAAIWTACFSRAWRTGLRKTQIDIFMTRQLFKKKEMKQGTWGVAGATERKIVELKLALTKQDSVLRCVPEISIKKSEIIMTITPGKTSKEDFAQELSKKLNLKKDEILQALPTGAFKIIKEKK
jgi:hypothetical protein